MRPRGGGTYIQNRTVTVSTSWTKQIVIIGLAIWETVTLKEIPRAQFLLAMIAGKVLRMPCLTQGSYHLPDNWLITGTATTLLLCIYTLTTHVRL